MSSHLPTDKHRVTVHIPPELYERLKRKAEEEGIPIEKLCVYMLETDMRSEFF